MSRVLPSLIMHHDGSFMMKSWYIPLGGAVKLNMDGSYKESDKCMGWGGIVRDEHGKWIYGFVASKRLKSAETR